jgi:hypothetical protein
MPEQSEKITKQKAYLSRLQDQLRRLRTCGESCDLKKEKIEDEIKAITRIINEYYSK